ncbi:hypothetical protein HAX54_050404, partial [Datura stramonium]|nr:hypothetical protein [Datura stramonium]
MVFESKLLRGDIVVSYLAGPQCQSPSLMLFFVFIPSDHVFDAFRTYIKYERFLYQDFQVLGVLAVFCNFMTIDYVKECYKGGYKSIWSSGSILREEFREKPTE